MASPRRALVLDANILIRAVLGPRVAQRIHCGMNLGAQPTARAPERLGTFFFWASAACWWARTTVLSMNSISKSASLLTALITRCHTPLFPQREKRVYVVCQLPNAGSKSRQGLPVGTLLPTGYSMAVCRYHGARKRSNAARPIPTHKHGRETKEMKAARSAGMSRLRVLENLMHLLNMTSARRTLGGGRGPPRFSITITLASVAPTTRQVP